MIPEFLQERLNEVARQHANVRLFALVDGAQYNTISGQSIEAEGDYIVSLFAGTDEESLAHAGPWLVEIVVEQFAAGIARIEALLPSVLWLISTDDTLTLARKLRERLNVSSPDGKEYLLRFWDPRALHALANSVAQSARRDFFGAALEWTYLHEKQRFYLRPYV
jgi:hypothetical protein